MSVCIQRTVSRLLGRHSRGIYQEVRVGPELDPIGSFNFSVYFPKLGEIGHKLDNFGTF